MGAYESVWAFAENPETLSELLSGSRALAAAQVTAVVLGPRMLADQAASSADRVFWLGEKREGSMLEDYAPTLASLLKSDPPDVFLIEATRRGRVIAGRLAVDLNVTVMADVLEFLPGEAIRVRHLVFGGGALQTDAPLAKPVIATVSPGFIAPASRGAKTAAGQVIAAQFVEPAWRLKVREVKPRPPATVDLSRAKKIVCAGRGLAKQEDLALINALAAALGAEVACTRPLAEGFDWLPRERYIGISGAKVEPDLYLGVGVSGQSQHQIGMSGSKLVVAINKDRSAPIFQDVDYGVVGDLYEVVPRMIKALG